MTTAQPGAIARAKAFGQAQLRRRPWLAHLVRAWQQSSRTNASLLAGALTFFSFLALFPLILLAVSITGYVLSSHPDLQRQLLDNVAKQAPGEFGKTLSDAIHTAINARAAVGLIGVGGVFFTGLGWVNNLRAATEQVWGHLPLQRSFLTAKVSDALVLLGLGVGLIVSVAITAVGTALTGTVLRALSAEGLPAITWVTKVVGIALAVVADMVIFGFLLIRLPKAEVPRYVALRGALLAALGFEVLKIFGTYYITRVSTSPTAGIFGSVLGILVWLNLVFRFLLYCTAWTATATPIAAGGDEPAGPVSDRVGALRRLPAETPPAAPPPGRRLAVALALGAWARRGRRGRR
ncbi:MAG: YhjD/YihY/BrkB family envelope integrity protein [bacterium]